MADPATFLGPNGANPSTAIRATVAALSTVTAGDLLMVGSGYVSRIRERTFAGVDVDGSPFAPYSTKGPFYLYVNKDATSSPAARATAAKNRHAKTGRIGIRTPLGIKYESYGAAKAAHGSGVNLYGMEQHPHMLDAMKVRAGGSELDISAAGLDFGSELEAFSGNQACTSLAIGFYGEEAGRAEGNDLGTKTIPARHFFGLNAADLAWGEKSIGERLMIRGKAAR